MLISGFAFLVLTRAALRALRPRRASCSRTPSRAAPPSTCKLPAGHEHRATDALAAADRAEAGRSYRDVKFFLTTVGAPAAAMSSAAGAADRTSATSTSSSWTSTERTGRTPLQLVEQIRDDIGDMPGRRDQGRAREGRARRPARRSASSLRRRLRHAGASRRRDHARHRERARAWWTCRTTSRRRCPELQFQRGPPARGAAGAGHGHDRPVPADGHLRHEEQPVPGGRGRVRHHRAPAGGRSATA